MFQKMRQRVGANGLRCTRRYSYPDKNRKEDVYVNVLGVYDTNMNTVATNSSGARKVPVREHTRKRRRVLSIAEEKVLVSSIKDLVAQGYKANNGFKTEYIGILERAMLKAFPLTDTRQEPHKLKK
ncbi:hypothetical protein BUALT_Bualt02G0060900 [Buddleja alternifolia]|uniref:Uncharacterized protein n=1 Tax=Buddleja alternifolia TaxID=168488 RepID=A0AAV6Y8Q7_9LAMI|nr:hypothetical protein BUALT_Bualt02G0060900 [Buddleja alternifolia]